MNASMKLLATLAPLVLLAGCGQPAAPESGQENGQESGVRSVDGASVRLNANPAAPAAGYFTIHGGAQPATLVEIASPDAARVEMHESRMENGVMRMDKLDEVPVASGEAVTFAPGGKHAMLWTISPQAIDAGHVRLTFRFADGEQIEAQAKIEKPGGDDMGGMDMPEGHEGH